MLQARRSQVQSSDEVNFFPIYLIVPSTHEPGVNSASNRNEY
jgi:hypothetical protein